jgi:transposase-like protein
MELLHRAKIGQVDFLRESLQNLVQALMELEITQQLHAERYEQRDERTG